MDMTKEEQEVYYAKNPEKKEIDSELRACKWEKPMGDSMGYKLFDALEEGFYDVQDLIIEYANNSKPKCEPICTDAERLTRALGDIMPMLGAVAWGVAKMDENDYYSVHGRGRNKNKKVDPKYPYAIVYMTTMDKEMVNCAPRFETMLATLQEYTDVAIIGMLLSSYVNRAGYSADNNMSGRYEVVMPPLGEKAGLGSFGRHGLLVNRKFGPRIRLGAILTDMPLVPSKKDNFNITPFCEKCGLCAQCCPGKAIDEGPCPEDGWKISDTACYGVWMAVGTDCGICLSACPFTQGVDQSLLDDIEKEEVIDKILKEHQEKYGVRKYNKDEMPFLGD